MCYFPSCNHTVGGIIAVDLGRNGSNEFTLSVERHKRNFNPGDDLPLWDRRCALFVCFFPHFICSLRWWNPIRVKSGRLHSAPAAWLTFHLSCVSERSGVALLSALPLIPCTWHHGALTQWNLINSAIDLTIKCEISCMNLSTIYQTGLTHN